MDQILGLKVSKLSEEKILEKVKIAIDSRKKMQIITLNTEMIMAAQNDLHLKRIINEAEIVVPESSGVYLAENYLSAKKGKKIVRLISSMWQTISGETGTLPTRISGVELSTSLAGLCEEFGYNLLLFGGKEGIAADAAANLKSQFKNLQVKGIYPGNSETQKALEEVQRIKADVILVAFGHGKQEKWLAENLAKTSASVGMGVGGTLDYFAKSTPRAPKWMRNLGMEWLFRLVVQPKRIKRQTSLLQFIKTLLKTS